VVQSYSLLNDEISEKIDVLEERVFCKKKTPDLLERSYQLKKVLTHARRFIRMMEECIPKASGKDIEAPYVRELDDKFKRTLFTLDDLELRIDQMAPIYLAIESHKNNDVMRVLTMFSAFFLPLSFIAGIYGMNFIHMPELRLCFGYPIVLGLMAIVSLLIWFLFKKKGWLNE